MNDNKLNQYGPAGSDSNDGLKVMPPQKAMFRSTTYPLDQCVVDIVNISRSFKEKISVIMGHLTGENRSLEEKPGNCNNVPMAFNINEAKANFEDVDAALQELGYLLFGEDVAKEMELNDEKLFEK